MSCHVSLQIDLLAENVVTLATLKRSTVFVYAYNKVEGSKEVGGGGGFVSSYTDLKTERLIIATERCTSLG